MCKKSLLVRLTDIDEQHLSTIFCCSAPPLSKVNATCKTHLLGTLKRETSRRRRYRFYILFFYKLHKNSNTEAGQKLLFVSLSWTLQVFHFIQI